VPFRTVDRSDANIGKTFPVLGRVATGAKSWSGDEINLMKPYKGTVRVTVHSGILAANGASSSSEFSAIVN
jgi:hypothetical protein